MLRSLVGSEMCIRDSLILETRKTTNQFGAIDGHINLSEGASLGEYSILVSTEDESAAETQEFKVEEFIKPDFEVEVQTNAGRYVDRELVDVTVSTNYFIGEPLQDTETTLTTYYATSSWWQDWRTKDNEPNQTSITNENGEAKFTTGADYVGNNSDNYYPVSYTHLTLPTICSV